MTVSYRPESPWSWLGAKFPEQPTSALAALRLAGLDWTVSLHDLYWQRSNVADLDQPLREEFVGVPNRKVVIRDSDHRILGTVGTAYVPLQNHEAFAVLDVACREHGVTLETAGYRAGGAQVWVLAKLPTGFEVVDGDRVDNYFLVSTGHDGATPYVSVPTPFRLACLNALEVAVAHGHRDMTVRLTHVKDNAQQLDAAADLVERHLTSAVQLQAKFRRLARTKLECGETDRYFAEVLGLEETSVPTAVAARRLAALGELYRHGRGVELARGTAWAAYNAVTEYVDHVRPAEAKNDKAALRALESALFGRNSVMKARALRLALAMVS